MLTVAAEFFPQTCLLSQTTMTSKLIIILSLINVLIVSSEDFPRTKRSDIDLQMCITNFDIHRDKIIRTQDSQNMGAQYLNEVDLGSREECLRLCCETEKCDVFVFEEKKSGGCYLFQCGPPENFKCKFTHHANYSSAVLAINRHLPDLESQMKLTKHEQDLNKLRKTDTEPEAPPENLRAPSVTSPAPTSSVEPKEILPIQSKSSEVRKCSRYQFECRSTSECIAIYNACDGIPQCADGSDEAPELQCPDTFTTPESIPLQSNNVPRPVKYEPNLPQHPLQPLTQIRLQPEIYHSQLAEESVGQPSAQGIPRPDADFIRPLQNVPNIPVNSRISYENPQLVPYGPAPVQVAPNNWGLGQPQLTPQIPQYGDKNSHIFNHKENGIQVPDGQDISQMQQYGMGRGPYNAKLYDSYRPPYQQEDWVVNADEGHNPGYQAENKDWHMDNTPKEGYKTKSGLPKLSNQVPENTKSNQPQSKEVVASHPDSPALAQDQYQPTIKIEKHTPTEKKENYPDVISYKMDVSDIEDGVSETASGAVLSLTLGLILTCIMALLIGCRLRVRRRMRKGGKSYAHEADYLVNGMYL